MSKAHSNQKGHNMKNKNPSDATTDVRTSGNENLDSNQSAQSMNAGNVSGSENSVEGSAHDVDPVNAMDNEGGASQPGQARDVEGESRTRSSGEYDSAGEGTLMSKAASLLDSQAVKKNLNLVKHKASDFISTSKEQLGDRFNTLSDDVKLRGMLADQSIKTNPYAYALGAVGIGFILGRAFSGKGRGDLDALMTTVNKINLGTITGLLGLKSDTDTDKATRTQPNYNSDQARKIG